MPFINRDGVKIYYEVHGDGPPLLLTHGYSSTSEMWRGQIATLSKSFKLIIWDMRGHGRTDYPEEQSQYTEQLSLEDMAAILDKVCGKGSKAIIGGLSLGGYNSIAFHWKYPERVHALLIVDTGPGFKKDDARKAWNEYALAAADEFDRKGLAALQDQSIERSSVSHRNAKGLARAARGMLTKSHSHVINSLPTIEVPSLVVLGIDDKPFIAASLYMAKVIPGSRGLVVIPNAGHAVNIDQPEAFVKAIAPFLEDVKQDIIGGQRIAKL